MKIEFIEDLPENHSESTILISGESSINFNGKQFFSITKENGNLTIYEIRYEYHCSPFKQIEILNQLIIVGHEEHCYVFEMNDNILHTGLKLSGYFGHIYIQDEFIYVADANGLYCLDQEGTELWSNVNLGIDGVIINEFRNSEIHGSGEWDPPGGWEDFIIDQKTGKKIEKRNANTM